MDETPAVSPDAASPADDVSALAWVQGELRKSLDTAHKALRRYLKEAEAVGGSDVDSVDPAVLRTARVQIHQGVGALELVGLPAPARLLRASEAAVQRMMAKPALLTPQAVDIVERGSFALMDYLSRVIAGKPLTPVALFPQYRDLQQLAGADRVHPADLWHDDFSWQEPPLDSVTTPRAADATTREVMESLVLGLMRHPDRTALQQMSDLCADLAAGVSHTGQPGGRRIATLWQLAAAFFEAQSHGLLASDVYTKRIASRLLAQMRALVQGRDELSDRLAQDLLFFCAHARSPSNRVPAPRLHGVRYAWQLDDSAAVDYDTPRLGRFDPAWIAQARKRVATARDAWSAVAGGELHRLAHLGEQFSLVGDSLQRLFPSGERLAASLAGAAMQTVGANAAPSAALAMEVATSILYLDASLEDGELDHPALPSRVQRLSTRIDDVRAGAAPQPLEAWMEELYRRVSDRQTMGSVVQELRVSLSEVEKQIDQYFRDPSQRELLIPVPGQLQSMRGVLSVLGLDQASQAVVRMRDDVDELSQTEVDPHLAVQAGTFDRLADNLGALSFLIDMLSVQPALAKSLFRFDPEQGTLSAVMGQSERPSAFAAFDTTASQQIEERPGLVEAARQALASLPDEAAAQQLRHFEQQAQVEDRPALAQALGAAQRRLASATDEDTREAVRSELAQAVSQFVPMAPPPPPPAPLPVPQVENLEDDAEMREIFIEEAREVVGNARAALDRLDAQPDDIGEFTTVRRAFHTLKGSSRMVGLRDYGEAAWACEQLYNARLAEQRPMDADLAGFTREALDELSAWIDDIEAGSAGARTPQALMQAADALRLHGVRSPRGGAAVAEAPPAAEPGFSFDLDLGELGEPAREPQPQAEPEPLQWRVPDLPSAADLDLGLPLLPEVQEPAAPEPAVAEPAAQELSFSLDLDLDLGEPVPPAPTLVPEPLPAATPLPETVEFDLSEFDAGDLGPALDELLPEPVPEPEPLPVAEVLVEPEAEPEAEPEPEDDLWLAADPPPVEALFGPLPPPPMVFEPRVEAPEPEPEPEPEAQPEPVEDEEPYKQIGDLKVPIPLFNIYLNEADEQSRRLGTDLAEWTVEHERAPVSDTAIALAHSLAGNSATVGYAALSGLARALEHALMRSQAVGRGRAGEPELFAEAAEEIRRLLHQFAAGFLRPVPPALLEQLADHERWPVPPPVMVTEFQPLEAAAPVQAPAAPLAAEPLALADEQIDAEDAIDAELFPIFEEEADELLPQLQGRLREWSARPADRSAASACMRTLHTFKGGARLAGAMRLGEMAHRLEAAIEHLLARSELHPADLEPLLGRADAVFAAFEALRAPDAADAAPAAAVEPVAEAAPVVAAPAPTPAALAWPAEELAPLTAADEPPARAEMRPVPPPAPAARIDWARFASDEASAAAPRLERAAPAGSGVVRVRGGLLDRMVNQAGEVSITRARIDSDVKQLQGSLGELTDSLERLRRQLRDIELQAETQISTRMEAAKAAAEAFDPLEMDRFTRFQELTRFMAESVNDVATLQRSLQRTLQSTEDQLAAQSRITRELQDDLLRTRMVEFESLADRLYRVVRQAGKDAAKQVRLDIVGGGIEIDRGVLERMTGPFEHLLRNCVAHGIELPAARAAAGKDATGSITLAITQEGNEVGVEVRDDGTGLDFERIRRRAVERGLLPADGQASDAELADLIFASGFTTADTVTEIAGRGVGMDVVRAEVNAMGGRIRTASTPGKGTSFRLLLPLTTAVTQVVMLRAGETTIAVPSTLVEVVRRVRADELESAYASGHYDLGGEPVPFYWLAALLASGTRGSSGARSQPVVVIRSAAQRVALHVDEVVGNQEVVVKNVGPQLARLPGLAGVTLLPSGGVALIYNPVALATLYGAQARERMSQRPAQVQAAVAAAPVDEAPLVMVVDDSLTVRRITQRLLVREGYRVVTAKDGLEALERLAEARPAVLLSDIEMPRMDGFDLARNVRADARLAGLPIIMITSRIAQKHRDYAASLGVDHYLGKPYAEDELLALVARHARPAVIH